MQDDIKFIYKTFHPVNSPALYGEQMFLHTLIKDRVEFLHNPESVEGLEGAIVNVRAFENEPYIDEFNAFIAPLKWVVVIVTGNEHGSSFYQKIKHPNSKIWVQSPTLNDKADRLIGFGWPSTDILSFEQKELKERPYDFSFSGNVNNFFRRECVQRLEKLPKTIVKVSGGFGQGLPYNEYLQLLSETKFAACPSAISTPDSFRIYEALEMGCVPVLDRAGAEYFQHVWGACPLMAMSDWAGLKIELMPDFEEFQALCKQWWAEAKQKVVDDLFNQINEIS